MPQSTQHSLVCILLLWTTILSIIQVVFTILFFTTGRNGLNNSVEEPARIIQPSQGTPLPPSSKDGLRLGAGKMITFTATGGHSTIEWLSKGSNVSVITEGGNALEIKKDGYFFLNLQVSTCIENGNLEHTVSLKSKDKVYLKGWINRRTNTTGMLSKVEEMPAGTKIEVNIHPQVKCINKLESATHLGIIFMAKPYM